MILIFDHIKSCLIAAFYIIEKKITMKISPEKIEEFKTFFLKRKEEILLATSNKEFDLGLEGGDETDIVQGNILKNVAERLSLRDRDALLRIIAALKKIETGIFGLCEECGEQILESRLKAIPDCILCISCAEEREMLSKQYRL